MGSRLNGILTQSTLAILIQISGGPLPVGWKSTSLGGLDRAFQTQKAETTPIPATLLSAYFDGLERHTGKGVSFAPNCVRRDNTVPAQGSCADDGLYNHTTAVRDRRILVTDAERGVVLAVALIDNPGTGPAHLPASQPVPSTYMVPQLIKIDNGSISRIEGTVKWMPSGYTSGWTAPKK